MGDCILAGFNRLKQICCSNRLKQTYCTSLLYIFLFMSLVFVFLVFPHPDIQIWLFRLCIYISKELLFYFYILWCGNWKWLYVLASQQAFGIMEKWLCLSLLSVFLSCSVTEEGMSYQSRDSPRLSIYGWYGVCINKMVAGNLNFPFFGCLH